MSALLELQGVRKSYGPVHALRGVDLEIDRGELVAIVGQSGSGKSTLLHVMGTLDRPTSGEVRVAGHEVSRLSDRQLAGLRARAVGFVFQQFFLLEGMTAEENVAQGLLYSGVPAVERRRRAAGLLKRVGLAQRARHTPSELSGGERQRVAIARALIARPEIVFADEPTGNLDSRSGEQIVALLRELHAEGHTIVVVTHNIELAGSLPRAIELRDGLVERDGALATA